MLVNKYSKIPDNWEDSVELVNTKSVQGEYVKIEKNALKSYQRLKQTLKLEGIIIELDSAYRSVIDQQQLWNNWIVEKGIEYVQKYVSFPGYSEHHTGLAIDICLRKEGKLVIENDEMTEDNETFDKIHQKLADYGFILRYPEGKEEVTGYSYEPWHFRYIYDTKIAKEIMNKGLTLEEFLGKRKKLNDKEVDK